MNRKTLSSPGLLVALAAAALVSLPAAAGDYGAASDADKDTGTTMKERASNAADSMREGAENIRLHATLEAKLAQSEHLSALMINTDVKDGVAIMDGEVETEAQRELATQLAKSIDGIVEVDNRLEVTGGKPTVAKRLKDGATDAAITAAVKSRLLVSTNTSGLAISVQTTNDVVTLSGEVETEEERELAELIAANTAGVKDVENRLEVKGS
jgi:hyperosmotically inducible periplasmic protein